MAELAPIHLAADLLLDLPDVHRAAILSDSWATFLALRHADEGGPILRLLDSKLSVLLEQGFDLVFQWVPAHVCISSNEEAERLAREAHSLSVPLFDSLQIIVRQHISLHHPDPPVTASAPPRRIPARHFVSVDCAFLLSLNKLCLDGRTLTSLAPCSQCTLYFVRKRQNPHPPFVRVCAAH